MTVAECVVLVLAVNLLLLGSAVLGLYLWDIPDEDEHVKHGRTRR